MSDIKKTPAADAEVNTYKKEAASLVDAVFDVGLAWASYGLKVGRAALDAGAKKLEQTAKTLEGLSTELGEKGEALKVDEHKEDKAA